MSNTVTFEIKGLDELQKKLQQEMPDKARKAIRDALRVGGGDILRAAKDAAPVDADGKDAGFLRDNIGVKTKIFKGELAGYALIGPTDATYPGRGITAGLVGRWLEFGTKHIAPRAWLTKAYERTKQQALDHIIEKFREILK
jgi:HK97 gp10 family phage protein